MLMNVFAAVYESDWLEVMESWTIIIEKNCPGNMLTVPTTSILIPSGIGIEAFRSQDYSHPNK